MSKTQNENTQRKRGDRWFLFLILFLFLIGLGIRGYGYLTQPPGSSQDMQPRSSRDQTNTLRQGEKRTIQPEPQSTSGTSGLVTALAPYLTEGGLSFFIGLCIGYFLRVVAKIFIVLVGAIYVCLILFSHYGLISVDWGSFQHIVQQILLNTKTQVEGLRGIITVGLPSVTMGCLGIWRGLKK
jgi:uncharacterized membrane protein (Fun14 family)